MLGHSMKLPVCPKCGSKKITLIGKRNALYPIGCLVFFLGFNILFAMLHRLQSPVEYRCESCETPFARRNVTERIALFSFVAIILSGIGFIAYLIWRVG